MSNFNPKKQKNNSFYQKNNLFKSDCFINNEKKFSQKIFQSNKSYKNQSEDYSTASSDRESIQLYDNTDLQGFKITVFGENINTITVQDPLDQINKIKEVKFAASKELIVPNQDDLPQPTFFLD